MLGSAALPVFSTLHWFPARQAFILEIRAATFLLFGKKHPFSGIIAAQIINITSSRAVRGCQSPAAAWPLQSPRHRVTSQCLAVQRGPICLGAHRVAGGAGPLLPLVLLLSGGQGAPHTAKDIPCKVWRAYLKDPAMKVGVDTHTQQSMYVVGERVWSQRPPLWHKVVPPRLLVVPRFLTACTDLSREGTDGTGPYCLILPHDTSLLRKRRSRSQMIPAHGNGLLYLGSICNWIKIHP